jgi:hypothetical protein
MNKARHFAAFRALLEIMSCLLVKKHGGAVWAKGEVDKCATFFLTLIAKASSLPQEQKPQKLQKQTSSAAWPRSWRPVRGSGRTLRLRRYTDGDQSRSIAECDSGVRYRFVGSLSRGTMSGFSLANSFKS